MSSTGMGQTAQSLSRGPPYPPTTAALGGTPSPIPDIPVSAVLLALFVGGAVAHMAVFQRNRARGHKFVFSVLLFAFCMSRLAALGLRIAWACHRTDANLALAATVLTSAGVLLLFLVNLVLALRVLRALRPPLGWSAPVRGAFRALIVCVAAVLVMVVVCAVHSAFTLDARARRMEREVMLFAGVFMAVLAFLPAVVGVLAVAAPPRKKKSAQGGVEGIDQVVEVDKFGTGRMATKVALLVCTSLLLTLGAGFRVGVNFAATPVNQPQWYHSRAAFYCFNFVLDLVVVYVYAVFRFDRRFHVPNGSSGPGDYSRGMSGPQGRGSGLLEDGEQAVGPAAETDKVQVWI